MKDTASPMQVSINNAASILVIGSVKVKNENVAINANKETVVQFTKGIVTQVKKK